jgi:hypothetical protein
MDHRMGGLLGQGTAGQLAGASAFERNTTSSGAPGLRQKAAIGVGDGGSMRVSSIKELMRPLRIANSMERRSGPSVIGLVLMSVEEIQG